MQYLLIISGTSFLGASLIILRRVHEIRNNGIKGIHGYDAYWPFDVIWEFIVETTKAMALATYHFAMPHIYSWISYLAYEMHKATRKLSTKFLRISNMVEGKMEIPENNNSSEYLKNISGYKEDKK